MPEHIVVVDRAGDWKPEFPRIPVVSAKEYLARQPDPGGDHTLRVLNLCRSYRYLSVGYYCSLLGEARQHRVMPSVRTINDLARRALYSLDFTDLDSQAQKAFGNPRGGLTATQMEMDVMFGQCQVRALADLARQLFDAFRAPLLQVEFRLSGQWRLHAVKPLHLHNLTAEQEARFVEALNAFLSKRWRQPRARRQYRYDLAILHNPKESLPPSDRKALMHFVRAGRARGIDVELIGRKDLGRLAEFDALFIRETTAIDHYTYQFAKKAEREGMVVIDDPDSILKCTNKIYLEELLRTHKVPTPRTMIVSRDNLDALDQQLDYPIVLKIPDGSFSRGVFKAGTRAELMDRAARLFKSSELILAQEYLYTDFDWRIGVLNRKPLFACQYFMSKSHWQIYNHAAGKRGKEGAFKTLAIADAPRTVVGTALKAANLVGNSLYGVDLKQTDKGVVVIEVNDNPNIDSEVEDLALGNALYEQVIDEVRRQLDAR